MSFGIGQSAISSIKNNRNLLSKRDRLKYRLSVNKTEKLEFKPEDITSYELNRLTKILKRENRRCLINRLIVVALIMSVLVLILYIIID